MQRNKTGISARHLTDTVAISRGVTVAISRGVTAAGTRIIRVNGLCKIIAC